MLNDLPTLFDLPDPLLPALPYGNTSGWSGSETSRARAEHDDRTGRTRERQQTVLTLLNVAGREGLTWHELSKATGWHHGQASGALSTMHKRYVISRLRETRNKCAIYVLPEHIDHRPTDAYKPNVSARLLLEILTEIEDDLRNGRNALAIARIQATRKELE